MTPLETYLAAIQGRVDKATPGPWNAFDNGSWGGQGAGVQIGDHSPGWFVTEPPTDSEKAANSFFIAHARTDLPKLIAALRVAVKELEFINTGHERDDDSFEAHYSNQMRLRAARLGSTKALAQIEKILGDG